MNYVEGRDNSIDILRFLALTAIIVAHISPSEWIFQLRNFDVPLMIFLSGEVFFISKGSNLQYSKYIYKRFKRLVLPTWIFITLYLFPSLIFDPVGFKYDRAFNYYMLITDWRIWIIRVFFIIALVSPMIKSLTSRLSKKKYLVYFALGLLISELLAHVSTNPYYIMILMMIPYSLVFSLGYVINKFSFRQQKFLGVIAVSLYLLIGLILFYHNGEYVQT